MGKELFGNFQQVKERVTSPYEFNSELLRINGFEKEFVQKDKRLFISGNNTFWKTFDFASFLTMIDSDVAKALHTCKGGFSGIVYDESEQQILVFSDSFGLFPIYFVHDPYKAFFSSSLRRILDEGIIEKEIDATVLLDYFRFGSFLPGTTLFRGVYQLKPGNYLRISEDHFSENTYFSWNKRFISNFSSVEQVFTEIDNLKNGLEEIEYTPIVPRFKELREFANTIDVPFTPSVVTRLSQPGWSEVFAAKEIFEGLPELNRKKWPMSFSPVLRTMIYRLGLWRWKGLEGQWKKEKLQQEYWDIEFLYQFEYQMIKDLYLKKLFNWEEWPKNGVFTFLHDQLGYGKDGYAYPVFGRLSLAEIWISLLSIQVPFLRYLFQKEDGTIDYPNLDKELYMYVMSVPDGLKEPEYQGNLASVYGKDTLPEKTTVLMDSISEEDWTAFTSGIQHLPYCNHKELFALVQSNSEKYQHILILGIWLDQVMNQGN